MNYTFLIAILAFLAIASPPMLYAAHREGKRRRAQIVKANDTLDEQIRKLTERSAHLKADNDHLRNELVMARAAYESERAKEHDEQGPRWRKNPPTHPEVGAAGSWWWVRSPVDKFEVVHLLTCYDDDSVIVYGNDAEGAFALAHERFRPEDWDPDTEWCPCLPPVDEHSTGL